MSQIEDNKKTVSAFLDAMNRGDTGAILEAYTEDGQVWTMGNTMISGKYSKEQIKGFADGIYEAFPQGLRFNIVGMVAEGDRVAVEAESEGAHASGVNCNNHYHFLFTLRDGKVVQLKEYMDTELATEVICGGQRP
ncbi:MAG: nuclear transport factor 2 family protein [Gammaproteobacteria bacterium]|nr:nuclear transport factor 2 family protein [Gammaproteobacteria bacterium]